jgi:hypothetical protein
MQTGLRIFVVCALLTMHQRKASIVEDLLNILKENWLVHKVKSFFLKLAQVTCASAVGPCCSKMVA